VVRQSPTGRRKLVWRWPSGQETTDAELGDPVSGSTRYFACVYDETAGTPELVGQMLLEAGGTCGKKPCWRARRSGLIYKDLTAAADGVRKLIIRPGISSKAKIKLLAKGANAPAIDLPLAQDPTVTVQLANSDGMCREARFSTPALRNDATRFKDKDDGP
jgi:hypothetical protein